MMYPLNVDVGWAHHAEFKKAGEDVIAKTLTKNNRWANSIRIFSWKTITAWYDRLPCNVVEFPVVHGLHHVYFPKAA